MALLFPKLFISKILIVSLFLHRGYSTIEVMTKNCSDSVVSYKTVSDSAVSMTPLSLTQRCQWHRGAWLSMVSIHMTLCRVSTIFFNSKNSWVLAIDGNRQTYPNPFLNIVLYSNARVVTFKNNCRYISSKPWTSTQKCLVIYSWVQISLNKKTVPKLYEDVF